MIMSMTPETPTPETDAAARRGAYIKAPALYYETHGKQLVHIDDARKLERERNAARAEIEAMREAIREAHDSLHKCSRVIGAPKTYEWADEDVCDAAYNSAQSTLSKLQPFITNAQPPKP